MTPLSESLNKSPKDALVHCFESLSLDKQVKSKQEKGQTVSPNELQQVTLKALGDRYSELNAKGATRTHEELSETAQIEALYSLIESNAPEFLDAAEAIGCKTPEKLAEEEQTAVDQFYKSPQLDELYAKAQKLKGNGERVTSTDIYNLLKEGSAEDKRLGELLKKHQNISKGAWELFKEKKARQYNVMENLAVSDFLTELSPQLYHDPEAAVKMFHTLHPQYAGGNKVAWFKKQLADNLPTKEKGWLNSISALYQSAEFKNIYNEVSTKLGHAPGWTDMKAALEATGKFEDQLFLMSKYESHSIKEWSATWSKVKEQFDAFETKALDVFADELANDPKAWADINKLAQDFQASHERFSGAKRLAWYKEQLGIMRAELEPKWQQRVEDFYAQDLPTIYNKVAANLEGAPHWQNIRAEISDPNLLYLLEEKFKTLSEGRWKQFWEQQREKFNAAENQYAQQFLDNLDLRKLDHPSQIAAQYEADGHFKANAWFKTKLNELTQTKRAEAEAHFEKTVSALPDSAIASAMLASFKQAENFTQRADWIEQAHRQVPRYTALIETNRATEARLTPYLAEFPDIAKDFAKLQSEYESGKKTYNEGFFSPKKYQEGLQRVSEKLNRREETVQKTLAAADKKKFSDVPQLKATKAVSYEEFRDTLKAKKFYELPADVRQNPRVRAALRAKTTQLHQQWLEARALHLEKNEAVQVKNSQTLINRVKLPKNLPDNIENLESFTLALKEAEVYAALPRKMLKNEAVRKTARAHNQALWREYQTQQATNTLVENPLEAPNVEKAERAIVGVKMTPALSAQIQASLADKDPTNKDHFAQAIREAGVYQGVDRRLWDNQALRELAWQQNLKLQQQFLAGETETVADEAADSVEQANDNLGLPGHYQINWDSLDKSISADQKERGLERFKQMHNRTETGLQTVMQSFHAPLGTFIMQVLSVMPKDRFERAMTALRSVHVESNNRAQASEWLKILTQTAGAEYLQKEMSAGWSDFKQKFSTYFGQSVDRAWLDDGTETSTDGLEAEVPSTEPMPEENDLVSLETNDETSDEAVDNTTSGSQSAGQDDELSTDEALPDAPEDTLATTAETFDEPEMETADVRLDETPVEVNTDALDNAVVELPDGQADLSISDSNLDVGEASDETDTDESELLADVLPETDAAEAELSADMHEDLEADAAAESIDDDVADDTPETALDAAAGESETDLPEGQSDLSLPESALDIGETTDVDTAETPSQDEETDLESDEAPDGTAELLADTPEEGVEDSSTELDATEADTQAPVESHDEDAPDLAPESQDTEAPEPIDNQALPDADREDVLPASDQAAEGDSEDLSPTKVAPEVSLDSEEPSINDRPELVDSSSEETTESHADLMPETEASDKLGAAIDTDEALDTPEVAPAPQKVEAPIEDEADLAEAEPANPIVLPIPVIAPAEAEAQQAAARQSWNQFQADDSVPETARPPIENGESSQSPVEMIIDELPAQWQQLARNPLRLRRLRTLLKQHQALDPQVPHFLTTQYQEQFVSQSMTVAKFLQQLKNYVAYTTDIPTKIVFQDVGQELSQTQAQSLFAAFSQQFHAAKNVQHLTLGFASSQLRVRPKGLPHNPTWMFTVPAAD